MDETLEKSPVSALLAAAAAGDQASWNRLVDRFFPLVLSIVRRYRLQGADAEDVSQTVWLRLVEKLGDIREPQALAGWIATTTRHECLHVIRRRRGVSLVDPTDHALPDDPDGPTVETRLLEAERHEALLAGLAELPDRQRSLLLLLLEDPPPSYEEVSARLGVPIGSIGPTRARALARLRDSQALQALRNA